MFYATIFPIGIQGIMRKQSSIKRSIVIIGMIAICSGYILTDPVVNRLELAMNEEEYLLIDDFSRANGESRLGLSTRRGWPAG